MGAAAAFQQASVLAFALAGTQEAGKSAICIRHLRQPRSRLRPDAPGTSRCRASSSSQLAQMTAGFARRKQEWELNRSLARKDVDIANRQIDAARIQAEHRRVRSAGCDRADGSRRGGGRVPRHQVHERRPVRVHERGARPRLRLLPPAGHRRRPPRRSPTRVRATGTARRLHRRRLLAAGHGHRDRCDRARRLAWHHRLDPAAAGPLPSRPAGVRHRPPEAASHPDHRRLTDCRVRIAAVPLHRPPHLRHARGAVRPRFPGALSTAHQTGHCQDGRPRSTPARPARHALGVGRLTHRRRPQWVPDRHPAPGSGVDLVHVTRQRERALRAGTRRRHAGAVRGHGRRLHLAARASQGGEPDRLPDDRGGAAHDRIHGTG